MFDSYLEYLFNIPFLNDIGEVLKNVGTRQKENNLL